jgi:hypothetical protein
MTVNPFFSFANASSAQIRNLFYTATACGKNQFNLLCKYDFLFILENCTKQKKNYNLFSARHTLCWKNRREKYERGKGGKKGNQFKIFHF